ncbi:DUF6056 family protein [Lachnotalea sp. AF33-28]|uniref:DUF6056 family protein n=1 Tax=Lachnotalea sp. AF33-28 TaxID=2292046 RepID=UPI000E523B6F|nr:DUF6056 family protein [Lachnotalea sp. AF33-28]RHP34978.1 hypothetical protein DWZ56_05560 [Lachnotalea sp. AF33-28]
MKSFTGKYRKYVAENKIFIFLFCFMLLLHFFLNTDRSDDVRYWEALQTQTVRDLVSNRYFTWSSRSVLEFVWFHLILLGVWSWRIADSIVWTMLAYVIYRFSDVADSSNNRKHLKIMAVELVLLYPFIQLGSAGWEATTLNYLWPVSFGLLACLPIKKIIYCEKIQWWEYGIYVICTAFSASHEQACVALFILTLIFSIYFIMKRTKNVFVYIQFLICLCSLIYIMRSPGNSVRYDREVWYWFPQYETLSLIDKIELGFSNGASYLLFKPNLIFLIFSIFLLLRAFKEPQTGRGMNIWSGIPLVSVGVLVLTRPLLQLYFPEMTRIIESVTPTGIITAGNYNMLSAYIPLALLILALVSVIMAFLFWCRDKKTCKYTWINILIILTGGVTAVIMGFSPTIFASGERTMVFLETAVLLSTQLLFARIIILSEHGILFIKYGVGVLAACNVIYFLLLID